MPRGFYSLIATQFSSALADNALLIVTIVLLDERGMAPWWAPLLKFGFTLAYVVFAPLIGPLADVMPKARLMACMNGVKIVGAIALLCGVHLVLGFAIVGVGAAAYAPAKYGLVTEIVGARRLVAANGWIEVSVVCAALIGTVIGGLLVSDLLRGSPAGVAVQGQLALAGLPAASTLSLSLGVLLALYGLSSVLNLLRP